MTYWCFSTSRIKKPSVGAIHPRCTTKMLNSYHSQTWKQTQFRFRNKKAKFCGIGSGLLGMGKRRPVFKLLEAVGTCSGLAIFFGAPIIRKYLICFSVWNLQIKSSKGSKKWGKQHNKSMYDKYSSDHNDIMSVYMCVEKTSWTSCFGHSSPQRGSSPCFWQPKKVHAGLPHRVAPASTRRFRGPAHTSFWASMQKLTGAKQRASLLLNQNMLIVSACLDS